MVDSSVAACWALPDEYSDLENRVLVMVGVEGMIVPAIFFYEIRNVLIINERRSRIAEPQITEALAKISAVTQSIEGIGGGDALMRLARAHRLTIYDAAYLELALRTGSSLATLDGRLAAAAAAEGIAVVA